MPPGPEQILADDLRYLRQVVLVGGDAAIPRDEDVPRLVDGLRDLAEVVVAGAAQHGQQPTALQRLVGFRPHHFGRAHGLSSLRG